MISAHAVKWRIEVGASGHSNLEGRGIRNLARFIVEAGSKLRAGERLYIFIGNNRALPDATTLGVFLDRCTTELRTKLMPHLRREQIRVSRGLGLPVPPSGKNSRKTTKTIKKEKK